MATLSAEVQTRRQTTELVNLTTLNDREATAIDTTVLDAAIADVVADFTREASIALDSADIDANHTPVAVEGVMARLHMNQKSSGAKEKGRFDAYLERLKALRSSESFPRVTPTTTSTLEPTAARGDPPRPGFDDPNFDGIIPNPPEEGGNLVGE